VHDLVALSLLVLALAVVSGLVAVAVTGLGAWRALKSFKRTTAEGLLATAALLEQLEARTGRSAERAARLEGAQASLGRSLAEAAVIGEAAGEIAAFAERARLTIPTS
jgi:hypothetical protein